MLVSQVSRDFYPMDLHTQRIIYTVNLILSILNLGRREPSLRQAFLQALKLVIVGMNDGY